MVALLAISYKKGEQKKCNENLNFFTTGKMYISPTEQKLT